MLMAGKNVVNPLNAVFFLEISIVINPNRTKVSFFKNEKKVLLLMLTVKEYIIWIIARIPQEGKRELDMMPFLIGA